MHYETPVPFGQDRLIPIWVATLALRQKSRTVHFERAAQMLEFFRFPKDGRYYRRMVQGFQRIFASTIFFGTEEQPSGSRLIDWARFHFFDQIHLWCAEHETCSSPPKGCPNTITLSEAFYNEIDQHRVPMEREVVIALANSPGVLDFYIWIAWKSWVLKSARIRVPLFSFGGLKEHLGCQIHAEDRFLRRWPELDHFVFKVLPCSASGANEPDTIVRSRIRQSSLRLVASAVWQIQSATDPRLALSSRYLTHGDFSPAIAPVTS